MAPSDATPRILIADDQADVLESLRLLLKPEGYAVDTADSPDSALTAANSRDFDAALIDLNYSRDTTSGAEGLELLEKLQGLDSTLPVVVMTAWGSVEVAVQAIRLGARDFIEKPWDNDRLLSILRNQVALGRALRRGLRLEAEKATLLTREAPDLIATCPRHGWQYDLRSGRCNTRPDYVPLPSFEVPLQGGELWVDLPEPYG